MTLSTGGTTSAYGSSFVKLGNTTILCGIRGEVGLVPAEADPTNASDRRHVVVNFDMPPLCSPHIRAGRTPEKAQIIGQKLNDLCEKLLRPANLYSTSDTVHSGGSRVAWYLYADLYCFDHDGNLLDCAVLALIAALKSTLLPSISITPAGEAVISSEISARTISLQLNHMPSSTTFGMFEGHVIADPNLEEEGIVEGTVSITYDENGILCSLEKPGGTFLTDEQLRECMKMARTRALQISSYIEKSADTYFKKLGVTANAS